MNTTVVNATETWQDKIIAHLVTYFEANIDGVEFCFRRPLTAVDPNGSIGLFYVAWEPVDEEIGQWEPSIQRYNFAAQVIVKHADEAAARILHGNISKSMRDALYRDASLRVSFGQLSIAGEDAIERFLRFGITRQSSANNQDAGSFIYLGQTEFYVDTQVAVL